MEVQESIDSLIQPQKENGPLLPSDDVQMVDLGSSQIASSTSKLMDIKEEQKMRTVDSNDVGINVVSRVAMHKTHKKQQLSKVKPVNTLSEMKTQRGDDVESSQAEFEHEDDISRVLANKSIDRKQSTVLDHEKKFYVSQKGLPEPKLANENKKLYFENYVVNYPLPAAYVLDAHIIRSKPTYSMQLTKYIFPKQTQYEISSHTVGGKTEISKYEEKFKMYENCIQIRIFQRKGQIMRSVLNIDLQGVLNGLIKFSSDDKLLVLFDQTRSIFTFYEFDKDNDLQKLKDDILGQNFKSQFDAGSQNMDLSFIQQIKFDPDNNYILGFGENKILILEHASNKYEIIKLNDKLLTQVNDASLLREGANLRCLVACKKQKIRQVVVFDILENHKEVKKYLESSSVIFQTNLQAENHSIRYFNLQFSSTEYLKLRISSDLDQIVLTDLQEKFILSQLNGSLVQRKLSHLQDKVVHFIQEDKSNHAFFILYSKDYDSKLYLGHSSKLKTTVKFPRNVEPGAIEVLDIFNEVQKEGSDLDGKEEINVVRMLSLDDDDFILDKAIYPIESKEDYQLDTSFAYKLGVEIQDKDQIKGSPVKYYQYVNSTMSAISMKWPYFAFQALFNALIVINAFDRRFVHRIEFEKEWESIVITDTYVTESNDLFVMVQRTDEYSLYMIDLDASNVREIKRSGCEERLYSPGEPILKYNRKDVEGKQVKDLHVRGSSSKESIDNNQICHVFIQHGDTIYHWIKYKENLKNQQLVNLSKTDSKKFNRKDDHCFFFLRNNTDGDQNIISQDIMRVNINFSTIELLTSFSENSQGKDISQFNYDNVKDRFIILFKKNSIQLGQSRYLFKILELESQKTLFEQQIKNKKLIGRLKSGLYTFKDGHMYFNNEVIKIRYDLIESVKNQTYKETEIFDFYDNIFILDDNQTIRSNTPIDSHQSHRFGYITVDKSHQSCRNLMLLPYLHERKIYLNRAKQNTDYFYTSIETKPLDEEKYHENLIEKLSKQNMKLSQEMKSKLLSSRIKSSISQQIQPNLSASLPETFTSIICMNETEFKYYVYTQDGLLINRVNFKKYVDKFGPPISTSSNGLNFIFKKDHDYDCCQDMNELREKMFTISVINMSIFGLIHIKDVNLLEEISKENQNCWLFKQDKENLIKHAKFKFTINDRFDVCVKIHYQATQDQKEEEFEVDQNKETFYVYEAAYKGLKERKLKKLSSNVKEMLEEDLKQHTIISDHKQRIKKFDQSTKQDFMMNVDYLFIWDDRKIKYYELDKDFNDGNAKDICFEISPENDLTSIKEIRTGSQKGLIVIIISQKNSTDTIFTWDVTDNIEKESNEVGKNYEILWDYKGYPYILQNGEVNFTQERCTIKAFHFQQLDEIKELNTNSELSSNKGHRFDGKNHNWLILGEYISLPFSYMSFVIKDKIESDFEHEIPNTNVFDPEPYYYIFNRSTCFLDGDFVYTRYLELKKVLKNFEEIDPMYLEIIHYRQDLLKVGDERLKNEKTQAQEVQSNTALHLAIQSGNKKSSDLILKYMSKINCNSSKNFQDIFDQLIEFSSFAQYLENLPHQTKIMKKKQILRVQNSYDDHIIKMDYSHLNYVDESFFKEKFQEDKEVVATGTNTYPVKVYSLKVGWILRQDNGRKFLDELLASKNLDFFNISTLQMLIKFFYYQFKNKLLYRLLPFYLIQLIMYEASMHTLEFYIHALYESKDQDGDHLILDEKSANLRKALLVIVTINFIIVILQILIIGSSVKAMRTKMNFLFRFYNWVDMIFITLNFIIMFDIYSILSDFAPESKSGEHTLKTIVQEKFFAGIGSKPIFTIEEFVAKAKFVRRIEVLGEIFIVMKSVQFLSLIDKLAPIIDTVVQIFFDIFWFMIILVLNGLVFASAFYIISQNQIMFDDLSDKEIEGINYKSFTSSMWYMHDLVLGTADHANFEVGKNPSQKDILYVLYFFVTFLMLIHLTNMLIAIMGETFGKRREVSEQIKMKDQLRFVMDNWHWKHSTFQDIKQVKCIIAAFSIEDDKNDNHEITYMRNDLKSLSKQILESFNENTIRDKEIMNQNRGIMDEIKLLKKVGQNNQSFLK